MFYVVRGVRRSSSPASCLHRAKSGRNRSIMLLIFTTEAQLDGYNDNNNGDDDDGDDYCTQAMSGQCLILIWISCTRARCMFFFLLSLSCCVLSFRLFALQQRSNKSAPIAAAPRFEYDISKVELPCWFFFDRVFFFAGSCSLMHTSTSHDL